MDFTLPPQEGSRGTEVRRYDGGTEKRPAKHWGVPVVGWWGQVRRKRRPYCRRRQMKGRLSPVTHHCGSAPETDSHCCCPPQRHTSPPAWGTCHGSLWEEQKESDQLAHEDYICIHDTTFLVRVKQCLYQLTREKRNCVTLGSDLIVNNHIIRSERDNRNTPQIWAIKFV